jgi:hypothetical protein
MHAVARLVRHVMAREGWSMREVVRRANNAGHPISNSRMSQMLRDEIKLFGHDNVSLLVDALDESPEVVIRAYLQSIGYDSPQAPKFTTERAVRVDENLSVDDRENLLALYRSMVRRQKRRAIDSAAAREESTSEEAPPSSPARVRRGKRRKGDDGGISEVGEVQAVGRSDGEMADVEDPLRETSGGDGEGDIA